MKDDFASESAAEKVEGERIFVDKTLGFYSALGGGKSSVFDVFHPRSVHRLWRAWRNGQPGQFDGSSTDGLVHGGVIVVAAASESASGRGEVLFEKVEHQLGDTLVHAPEEEQELFAVLDRFAACLLYTSPSPRDRG